MNTKQKTMQAAPVQKAMPKKEVGKLKAGTWIELWWNDSPNTVALLLDKMQDGPGEITLDLLHARNDGTFDIRMGRATNRQVVRSLGTAVPPNLVPLKEGGIVRFIMPI